MKQEIKFIVTPTENPDGVVGHARTVVNFSCGLGIELLKDVIEKHIPIVNHDEVTTFTMAQTDNILAATLRHDLDAPYSCQGGVCSSCLAKVTEGNAVMIKNSILTDSEVADGFILTCQAHPTTAKISIDFDDV